MMKNHYSEADLLETYYTQPGESMPVMMHLAACAECAARYERLETKLRSISACSSEKPETFWSRQRISIMRRIGARQQGQQMWMRGLRVAAAASFAFLLGGLVVYKSVEPALETPGGEPAIVRPVNVAVKTADTTSDPWQSEELSDYQSVVAWESWIDEGKKPQGDTSL